MKQLQSTNDIFRLEIEKDKLIWHIYRQDDVYRIIREPEAWNIHQL